MLTVPASFDEEARELTVMAAREAGLEKLTLLEEPAAAFYSWIANNLAHSRKKLFDGQIVLVCDVGGGTSDFTPDPRRRAKATCVDFTRTAVGKHLLLGGDNLDLTLAWLVETKLGTQLSIRQRSGLRRQCSAAKERLLNDPNLKSVEITVLGAGSSLIGKSLKTEILREEALELALEGFLPFTRARRSAEGREAQPLPRTRPALRFRSRHHAPPERLPRTSAAQAPDAILFNGGFFIPEILPRARGRRRRRMVRPPSRDPRESRSRSRRRARRGLLLLRALHRQRRAGPRRSAAHVLHRPRRAARRQVPRRLPGAARRRRRRRHRDR